MTVVEATVEESAKGPRLLWKWGYTSDFMTYVARAKTINGARFKGKSEPKHWSAPATVDNCLALRRAYGDELVLAPALKEWFIAQRVQHDIAVAATVAADAELAMLPTVAPRLAAALRPDQRAGVAAVAAGYQGSLLVADKPGLGKTIETIGGVLEADRQGPVLVVCPKISVKNVWWRELTKWTDEPVYIARGTRQQREAALAEFSEEPAERKWLIIVSEMLRVQRKPNDTEVKANAKKRGRIEGYEYPKLFSDPWDTIIVDESQRMLGSLTVAKSNLMGEGLASLPLAVGGRKYAMSGTPFGKGGRVQGMFGTLHWLWPEEYTSFWRWAGNHFEIETSTFGRGKTAMKVVGLKDKNDPQGEAFMKSLGPRILRRTKEEVLPNLPPKQYIEVVCEMDPVQRNQYKQLGDDAEVLVPTGVSGRSSKTSILANGVLAEITRAKQIAGAAIWKDVNAGKVRFMQDHSCKVDALMEKLDARGILTGDGDTKVIVSSRYNQFLYDVVIPRLEEANVLYLMLTGSTSDKKRDEAMDQFQSSGGPRVFVLNSKAGGVSVTLDAADEVHCLDELDNPEDNEQLEDRAHRASRMHQVTIYYYRTAGTYDVNVAASVENKRLAQFEVLDGRRGIQDVRSWIKYNEETA